jgi:hypothetical protein
MKHLAAAVVGIALCIAPAGARAEITVKDYLAATGEEREVYRMWLSAVESGFGWYAAASSGPKLYCQPKNMALTDDQLDDIFRRFVSAHPDTANTAEYAALTLLLALQDTFPCDAGGD